MDMRTRLVLAGGIVCWIATATLAQQPAPGDAPREVVIDLGGLKVNRTRMFVEIPGWVSLDRGLIELFACSPSGKRYESVFVLGCRPDMMQAGLLALGLKRGQSGRFQGDKVKDAGSPVVLTVSWTDPETGKSRIYRAEDLVWSTRTSKPMERVGWVFVGSRFVKNPQTGREVFMAAVTGTLIVTYHDPDAILDTAHTDGTDDTVFYANQALLPAKGTEIVLRIYGKEAYDALPEAEKVPALDAGPGEPGQEGTPPQEQQQPRDPNATEER